MSPSPPLLRVRHSPCDMKLGQPLTLAPEGGFKHVAVAVTGKVKPWRREIEK